VIIIVLLKCDLDDSYLLKKLELSYNFKCEQCYESGYGLLSCLKFTNYDLLNKSSNIAAALGEINVKAAISMNLITLCCTA